MSAQPITYTVESIHDILQIPADRRDAFWAELRLALELHEFALGDEPAVQGKGMRWTDDGEIRSDLEVNGEVFLSLQVTDGVQS